MLTGPRFRVAKPVRVEALEYQLFRAEDIRRRSVVEVTDPTLYHKNLPKVGGVNDYRMGTVDRRYRCGTCGHDVERCNGHLGHIELPAPVYHIGFIENVLKILRVTCFFCSRLMVTMKTRRKTTKVRRTVRYVVEPCGKCGAAADDVLHADDDEDASDSDDDAKTSEACTDCEYGERTESVSRTDYVIDPNPHLASIVRSTRGQARFKAITALNSSNKQSVCAFCKGYGPHYTNDGMAILADWSAVEDLLDPQDADVLARPFTPAEAYSILNNIPDVDARVLGFDTTRNHPRDLMITVMPVCPPIVRPVIMLSDMSRSKGQDDLTRKLQDIVKRSVALRAEMEDSDIDTLRGLSEEEFTPKLRRLYGALQYHVATHFQAEIKGEKKSTQRSGAPTRTLCERIKGKTGRVRGNLMGKRVEFTARSVISPDPIMDINHVGVPVVIALETTVPVRVTQRNRAALTQRVLNGPERLDGATTVITDTGSMINLRMTDHETRRMFSLQEGWVVERPLNDGDIVLLNRQPTLHKPSMMAHIVKVMLFDKTIRLPVPDTSPYNADFDGDEMNLHIPQSVQAQAEARTIMAVEHQMLNAQYNKPTIGLVQDSVSGSYHMTRKDVFITRDEAMNLVMTLRHADTPTGQVWSLPVPAILKPRPLWTGKQIYSMAFPTTLSMSKTVRDGQPHDYHDPLERSVLIRDGQLLCGAMCKQTLGTSSGGVVHVICKDVSNLRAMNFVSDAQRLSIEWVTQFGLSVGISDCVSDASTEASVHTIIRRALRKVERLREMVRSGVVYAPPEAVEAEISGILAQIIDRAGRIVQNTLTDKNRIHALAVAGAKGSRINISQIMAVVGQQSVSGKRVGPEAPPGVDDTRTPEERGLVVNSYTIGLEPREVFHHAMAGREGLVDTAVKTSQTGYIQRRLVKGMEAMRVKEGGVVHNAECKIVQFHYGGDDMDAQYLERCSLRFLTYGDEKLHSAVVWSSPDDPTAAEMSAREWSVLRTLRDECRDAKITHMTPELSSTVYLPVNPPRFLESLLKTPTTPPTPTTPHGTPITARTAFELVDSLCEWLYDQFEQRGSSSLYLRAMIREVFLTRVLVRVSRNALTRCVDRIRDRVMRYRAVPGEMVGALAAESVGEPATQMTLNSVEYTTALIIHDTQLPSEWRVQRVTIGSWIDRLMNRHADRVQRVPANRTEYLEFPDAKQYTVPSVDADGNVSWKQVTAVTRHLPVGRLIRIVTASGREVTATRQKSFLRWNADVQRIEETEGAALRVGDLVPVQHAAPTAAERRSSVAMSYTPRDIQFLNGFMLGAVAFGGARAEPMGDVTLPAFRRGGAYARRMASEWKRRLAADTAAWEAFHLRLAQPLVALLNATPTEVLGVLALVDKCLADEDFGAVVMHAEAVHVFTWLAATMNVFVTVEWNEARDRASCRVIERPQERGHTVQSDVILDPILRIEETDSEHVSVYDLTVADTLNFNIANGLCMRDTFHYTGVASKNVTLGVPRLKELVNCSKNISTPSLTVVPTLLYEQHPSMLSVLRQSLERVSLADVVSSDSVVFDPDPNSTEIAADREIVQLARIFRPPRNHSPSQYVIRFVLDKHKMMRRALVPFDVAECVRSYLQSEGEVIYSEFNMSEWVIRVRLSDAHAMVERLPPDGDARWKAERTINYHILGRMLENIYLGGVPGITNASERRVAATTTDPETGEARDTMRTVIDTVGSNLVKTWLVDGVDWTRTITNNVDELTRVLGIEAGLALLFHEMKAVLSFDGTYVNVRHVMMVTDTIGFRGYLVPMTRFGINRVDVGVGCRASFEETMDMFLNAAAYNETDPLAGVSENIMTGGRVPMGTGTVVPMLDEAYRKQIMRGLEDSGVPTAEPVVYRSMITEWGDLSSAEVPVLHPPPPLPAFVPAMEPPPEMPGASAFFSGVLPPPPDFMTSFPGLPSTAGIEAPPSFPPVPEDADSAAYRPSSPALFALGDEQERQEYRPSSPNLQALRESAMFSGESPPPPDMSVESIRMLMESLEGPPRPSGVLDSKEVLPVASNAPAEPRPVDPSFTRDLQSNLDALLEWVDTSNLDDDE